MLFNKHVWMNKQTRAGTCLSCPSPATCGRDQAFVSAPEAVAPGGQEVALGSVERPGQQMARWVSERGSLKQAQPHTQAPRTRSLTSERQSAPRHGSPYLTALLRFKAIHFLRFKVLSPAQTPPK